MQSHRASTLAEPIIDSAISAASPLEHGRIRWDLGVGVAATEAGPMLLFQLYLFTPSPILGAGLIVEYSAGPVSVLSESLELRRLVDELVGKLIEARSRALAPTLELPGP